MIKGEDLWPLTDKREHQFLTSPRSIVRQSVLEEGTYSRDIMGVQVKFNSQMPDLNTKMDKGSIL